MCGFAGMFHPEGITLRDRDVLSDMSRSIRFRGPDESSLVAEEKIAFAFRRLSIIDLSGGSQPKSTSDGKISGVFNGEIYNYRELKENFLKGESFETASELEIMLKLYRKMGEEFIRTLRGMFAIAFYDREEQTVFLGRDPFGIKPLYYRRTEKGITFASEAKAFLFDDSFSALDYKTDAALRRDLKEKLYGKTVLIVAQRIATIMGADQIIVLDEGRIVGCGTHVELLNSCETYREIALSQLSEQELFGGGEVA